MALSRAFMVTTICLLSCALTVAQTPGRSDWKVAPQLFAGMELKYVGNYVEEALSPNVQYQRRYRLDATLFVLDAAPRRFDVAFLTSLSLREQPKDGRTSVTSQPHICPVGDGDSRWPGTIARAGTLEHAGLWASHARVWHDRGDTGHEIEPRSVLGSQRAGPAAAHLASDWRRNLRERYLHQSCRQSTIRGLGSAPRRPCSLAAP